ncbi:MAG TPA: hypothetical protein VGG61_08085, partial [Gemmataceae bacterium]
GFVTGEIERRTGDIVGPDVRCSRFHTPLIEPNMQISCIRLSDKSLTPSHTTGRGQAVSGVRAGSSRKGARVKLSGEMVTSTRAENGVLAYQKFISDDRRTVYVHERYEDSDAAVAHLPTFVAIFGELSERGAGGANTEISHVCGLRRGCPGRCS